MASSRVALFICFCSFFRVGFLCLGGEGGAALFGGFCASLEAVDTAFGVDNLFFTSEEWV